MNGLRLLTLVTNALGRKPTAVEVEAWRAVLELVRDDDADQALVAHRAASPHPPTPADVRRHATVIANDRAMRAEAAERRREIETGMTADGRPLVPMPASVRDGLRQLAARQRARDTALESEDAG